MTIHIDFETYSAAGYTLIGGKPKAIHGTSGIGAVGSRNYTTDPSADILSLAYNLGDGLGPRLWIPIMPPPVDLFEAPGRIHAWNAMFEWQVWNFIAARRYGWPRIPLTRMYDDMASAAAYTLPLKLAKAGEAIGAPVQKDAEGQRLLRLFSIPPRQRLTDHPVDGQKLYNYNLTDIEAEASIAERVPPLSPNELAIWDMDQRINARGVQVDLHTVFKMEAILEEATDHYTSRCEEQTGGIKPTEVQKLLAWLQRQGVNAPNLQAATIERLLKRDLPAHVAEVLRIRQTIGSASVKKIHALSRNTTPDGRLYNSFQYCGALHTGRWAGRVVQLQNLPNSGPRVRVYACCNEQGDGATTVCPRCRRDGYEEQEWGSEAVERLIRQTHGQDAFMDLLKRYTDPVAPISGSLRGLFISAPGHDLICSDFSAIEAVVLAFLSREQWRMEVFRTHGKIYELSASKISGVPFEEMMVYSHNTGEHHPLRKKGKVAELASGYQGGLGAWKKFGADRWMNDDEIRQAVRAWRDASPNIVKFWYGVQDAAEKAIRNRGRMYDYGPVSFRMIGDVLTCLLPSSRLLYYHKAEMWGDEITFMGWDSMSNKWARLSTYGGRLTENIVQAVSRDILASSMLKLEAAGYPIVMHVHDEVIAEVPEGFGSVEEFEQIMSTMPAWAADWPVRAKGGWRAKRYRKD